MSTPYNLSHQPEIFLNQTKICPKKFSNPHSSIPSCKHKKGHPSGQPFPQIHPKSYTLNDEPHPQVLFTFGFSNLNPAASNVST